MKIERKQKIGIVGAGSVERPYAYSCMVGGVGKHIGLFDVATPKLNAEVLDLDRGLIFVPEVEEHAHNTHQEAAPPDRRHDHNL